MHYLKLNYLCSALPLCFLCAGLTANAFAENCQIQLSQTTLDYGNLTRAAIKDKQSSSQKSSLGDRALTLNVLCQQPTAMGLAIEGLGAQDGFKFGESGQFVMRLSDALLDGKPVNLGSSQASGTLVIKPSASVLVVPGSNVFPLNGEHLSKGKSLSLQVHIAPEVTEAATRVRAQTTWEGNAIFSVVEN